MPHRPLLLAASALLLLAGFALAPAVSHADAHSGSDRVKADRHTLLALGFTKVRSRDILRADRDNDGYLNGRELRRLRSRELSKLLDND